MHTTFLEESFKDMKENTGSLRFYTICCFTRFIRCMNDNSVEPEIIIGNTCLRWQNHAKSASTLNLAL